MTLVLLEKLIQPGTSIASHFAVFLNKTTIYVMMASVGSTARHWRPCGEKMMVEEEQQNFQRRLFKADLLLIGEIAVMTVGLETIMILLPHSHLTLGESVEQGRRG